MRVVNLYVIEALHFQISRHPSLIIKLIVLPFNLKLIQRCYNYLIHPFIFKAQEHNDGNKVFLCDFLQKQLFFQELLSLVNELIL